MRQTNGEMDELERNGTAAQLPIRGLQARAHDGREELGTALVSEGRHLVGPAQRL